MPSSFVVSSSDRSCLQAKHKHHALSGTLHAFPLQQMAQPRLYFSHLSSAAPIHPRASASSAHTLNSTGLLPRCAWRQALTQELILLNPGRAVQGFDYIQNTQQNLLISCASDEGWKDYAIQQLWVLVWGRAYFIAIASISIIVAFKF